MQAYVVRVWLSDRPGALGAVASRIGAVRGDVVGIDILERGGGRAVDELVVELPDDTPLDLLLHEIGQVDGVDVEDVRPVAAAGHDPRADALETAAVLVGASSAEGLLDALCTHGAVALGARWAVVLDVDNALVHSAYGPVPPAPWVVAFVLGATPGDATVPDVIWVPMPGADLAFALGRSATPFRARERRHAAALARIADTRYRELVVQSVAHDLARSTARFHRV